MYPQDAGYGGNSLNRHDEISLDFTELIDRALDGTITAEQFALLDHQIATNENACIYYQEFITTYVGLMDLQGVLPKTFDIPWQKMLYETNEKGVTSRAEGCHNLYNLEPDLTEEEKKRRIEIYASEQLEAYLKQQYRDVMYQQTRRSDRDIWEVISGATKSLGAFFSTGSKIVKATAACLLTILLLILVFSHFYMTFFSRDVATINTSLDAAFADNQAVEAGTRLAIRDDPLFLQTGLIEVSFDGGAKVLLEGPAAFRLKSADRMTLDNGRLFATVTDDAKGFIVDTPNSRVIDLGTEFGVRVEKDGTSDLYMFKGKAELASGSGTRDKRILTVTASQARRVGMSGQVRDIPITENAFVRHFYPETGFIWRGQRLSLVDLVGQGNGLGTGRADVYVDPIDGYKESIYCDGKGNEYRKLTSNPFIDGLFIPDGNSRQIISSLGHQFEDCPQTNGECYAGLTANPSQGLYYDGSNNLVIRVVDPSARGNPAFVLANETYVVTGTESGVELMSDDRTQNRLGTGTWVHFQLGTPVILAANRQYGFDVTVIYGNRGFYFETAGVVEDSYPGGVAYSTGTKGGINSLNLDQVHDGDHTFVVELAQTGPIESTQGGPKISYSTEAPDIGPEDVFFLEESTIDNRNVGGFPGQTYSGDNDYATYIARDRRGLGQTFTTGDNPDGYIMKGFWLKNVSYSENLSDGNGTWWYIGPSDMRNSIIRFNGQDYGSREHPCIVMHANLGITFDLNAIRAQCPDIKMTHFVSQFGIADFNEQAECNADFWVLVDGKVKQSRRNIKQKNVLSDFSVELDPSARFLTLVTTDGGDIDRKGAYQRAYTCDWCVFVEPELVLETGDSSVNIHKRQRTDITVDEK
jgi:hypothetical protein